MYRADLPMEFIDKLNKHIDDNVITKNQNLGENLVGQINQNKKSIQLNIDMFDTDMGKMLKKILDNCSKNYLNNIKHADALPDTFEAWTVHSYSGDYNPLHDHGTITPSGLSMVLYLKVPKCISDLSETVDDLYNASGACDGFTYFNWFHTTPLAVQQFYMAGEEYVKPIVGRLLIFPNWLKHAVMPFHGEGERRTLAANANIITTSVFDWKNESSEKLNELLTFIRKKRKNIFD